MFYSKKILVFRPYQFQKKEKTNSGYKHNNKTSKEGREGVKWELGFAFFRGWEMGFCALGLGFMKKSNREMGIGFQFEQHRLGLWDLNWDLEKTLSWEMGLGAPFTTLSKQ